MKLTENRLRKLIKILIKESNNSFLNHRDKINISIFDKHCKVSQMGNRYENKFVFAIQFDENAHLDAEKGELLDFIYEKIEKTIYNRPLSAHFDIVSFDLGIPAYTWSLKCKYNPKLMEEAWNLPASMLECYLKPALAELFMKACESLDEEYGIDKYNLPF